MHERTLNTVISLNRVLEWLSFPISWHPGILYLPLQTHAILFSSSTSCMSFVHCPVFTHHLPPSLGLLAFIVIFYCYISVWKNLTAVFHSAQFFPCSGHVLMSQSAALFISITDIFVPNISFFSVLSFFFFVHVLRLFSQIICFLFHEP